MNRLLTKAELAFFAVPRTWREIEMRFGQEAKTEEFRNTIILADDEGGSGMLHYLHPKRSWVLTDTGKASVGKPMITRELNIYPDSRTALQRERDESGADFNALLERPGLADVVVGVDYGRGKDETAAVVLNPEAELQRLIEEQGEDDDG